MSTRMSLMYAAIFCPCMAGIADADATSSRHAPTAERLIRQALLLLTTAAAWCAAATTASRSPTQLTRTPYAVHGHSSCCCSCCDGLHMWCPEPARLSALLHTVTCHSRCLHPFGISISRRGMERGSWRCGVEPVRGFEGGGGHSDSQWGAARTALLHH